METIRVALIHNIVTPYRTVLFNALANHPQIDLHVFYCAKSHEKRNWSTPVELSHKHTFLPGFALDRADFHYHVNPTIGTALYRGDFDATMVGGSTNFTMQLGFVASKFATSGTVLWTERIRPPEGFLGTVVDSGSRALANWADSVVVPTNKARRYQVRNGINPDDVFVAPNVVDNDTYYSDRNTEGPVRIVFVGQLIERKGVSFLLEAYEQVGNNQTELVIVGDGPNRGEYERLADELGIEVKFTGWVSENQKCRELAEANLFVLPSVEDLAPLVMNEAMASGLPILTTEGVGNASDMIIEGANGYIVPIRDAEALADRLSKLLSDSLSLERMGNRSQQILDEMFSPSAAAEQFVAAVKQASNRSLSG